MKAVVFEEHYWRRTLWPRIVQDYGKGIMVSWACKERLGFTVREHKAPISDDGHFWEYHVGSTLYLHTLCKDSTTSYLFVVGRSIFRL